ncbi:ABC transporter ATP-binding protein [Alicyclobacillus acidiphilus]|uniref:ABC transporter ATP-binding protein n=1 Tax=Alicyclobacillus acidiphilus TaxID=182455 RepID=UPI0008314A30|nr:ABC transporter ATP-binding protein [Alicyclobacillus acidiphilus]
MATELLQVEDVSKRFRVRGRTLHAVEKVSFKLSPGKTLGLVGESGSGKSTLGRLALRLLGVDEGRVLFQGRDITQLSNKQLRPLRKDMQMIFQDPQASLNARMTVGRAIEEGLIIHGIGSKSDRKERVYRVLERVGLPFEASYAYPHELSGGQLQRVGIARALAVGPKLVVCDEPVSALDVSIQIQVINLLQELQQELGLAYIFIAHNLAVVEYLSDEIAVLYLGNVVEQAPAEELFKKPSHPYTQTLMKSVLKIPEPGSEEQSLSHIQGEIPSPFSPPSGCSFHPRCPFAEDICKRKKPEPHMVGTGHLVACHLAN